ncbi:MAG: hypothetical protein ABL914_01200 [Novosphingobium sp.]|uniref:hypothetical protein n=1 Tax=Novosphingobium sp. TaxID=1874826 RepID=UPI0032BC232A
MSVAKQLDGEGVKGAQETELVTQQDPLSQGDIIRIEWPGHMVGPELGVVINADCDIAHCKTDGVIAFLPLYHFREYLSEFWVANHIQEVIDSATRTVLRLANDEDPAALHAWLSTDAPEAVGQKISEHRSLKNGDSTALMRELNRLAVCLDGNKEHIQAFKEICLLESDSEKYARTHITAAKKAMGDGHFFISELAGNQSVGFVIRMRRIYSIQEECVFLSNSDQKSKSIGEIESAFRIARLTPLYRFKLLQLFAHQFSRIGLSDETMALSSLAIDDLVMQFSGDRK